MKKVLFSSIFLALLCFACSKSRVEETITPEPPENPFDAIDYGNVEVPQLPIDSNSFVGIHHDILSTSCNQPGCHDGTFEPDYRTVQSAYNSLVLHPVTKNYDPVQDGRNPLPYRVHPGNSEESMLWHRLTMHNPPNFEQMPAAGTPLPEASLQRIKNWIEEGAIDPFGNAPMRVAEEPNCFGLLAFTPNPIIPSLTFRLDTIRIDEIDFNPFVALAGQELELWFGFMDYLDEDTYEFGNNLKINKLQLSTNLYDFSGGVELDLEIANTPKKLPELFSLPKSEIPQSLQNIFAPIVGEEVPYTHTVTFDPVALGFPVNQFVFMRILVQDDTHGVTEIPDQSSLLPMQLYYTFFLFEP